MTKAQSSQLIFLFAVAGLDVLAFGRWFLHAHPVGTVVGCVLLLAGLAAWYAKVRDADDDVARRTARSLVLAMTILVLVPFLLRKLLALS